MNPMQTIIPIMKSGVKAKVVERILVVTFRNSTPPMVWRMDLEKNHSFALAAQQEGQEWVLGVRTPKGDFTPVTRFAERQTMEKALGTIENAMLADPAGLTAKVKRTAAVTAVIVGIIVTGLTLMTWIPSGRPIPASASGPAANAPVQGVPMDADAILGK